MKERSIQFSGQNPVLIIEDKKIETRRIIKVQPDDLSGTGRWSFIVSSTDSLARDKWSFKVLDEAGSINTGRGREKELALVACPYGLVSDRLIVKEASWMWCERLRNGMTKTGREKFRYVPAFNADSVVYCASSAKPQVRAFNNYFCWRYKSARFMPREASRLTLEISGVWIERLQDITEAGALAEGITGPHNVGYPAFRMPGDSKPRYSSAVAAYEALWESIHGEGSWELNPWVWVISFKRIEKGGA